MAPNRKPTLNSLGLAEVPKDIPRKHALILKALLTVVNLLPLTIFLIVVSVHVQSDFKEGEVCLFKDGTNGAIPCYVDAKLNFEHYSNSLQLLMGPLLKNQIDWRVTCIQDPLIETGRDFDMVNYIAVRNSRVIQAQTIAARAEEYNHAPVTVPRGTNCYYESVITVSNIALIQFVEMILVGVVVFSLVGNSFITNNETPMFVSLVALVMNIEVLGIPIAFIIFLVSNFILYLYSKFFGRTVTVLTSDEDPDKITVL